ncbi:MAG TPA: nuclear transport factor 2 family protein [Flavobacteriaceae bacterium]|nr:nuclear transport factor 2 family protein [Flavobacteriaceae bacterium]
MKTLYILLLALSIMACKQEIRYTQQSPEIETFKKSINDYKTMNWESLATHYADTAIVANNVPKEKAKSVSEAIKINKEDAEIFTWVVENEEYEMVVTDEGETWVNFWGLWKGTMKSTNKVYTVPFHSTARFIDGKIVEEYGYWNNSEIVSDLQALQNATDTNSETEDDVTP